MSLSKEIKLIRQRRLMSQSDFAKELNVSYTTVNRWETGKARPNINAMKEIKRFCEQSNIDYGVIEREWLNSDDN